MAHWLGASAVPGEEQGLVLTTYISLLTATWKQFRRYDTFSLLSTPACMGKKYRHVHINKNKIKFQN